MTTTIRNRDQVEMIHRLITHVLDDLLLWEKLQAEQPTYGGDSHDSYLMHSRVHNLYSAHPAYGPIDLDLKPRAAMLAIYAYLCNFLTAYQEGGNDGPWRFPTAGGDHDNALWYEDRNLARPSDDGQRGDYAYFTTYVNVATQLGLDDEEFYQRVGAYHRALGLHQKLDAWKSEVERAFEQVDIFEEGN